MKTRALFCLFFLGLAAVAAVAQQFSESVQVTLVEVPVTVVDRAGNPVTGLTRDDFEVTDDGRKVTLVGFETIEMNASTVADTARPLPPAAYRNFLLLFDLANSSPGTLRRAQDAARDFVSSQLGPRDLAGVATFSVEHGLQVVTSFTSDRSALAHAVNTLGRPKYFKVADPLRIAPPRAELQQASARKQENPVDIAMEELLEKNDLSQRGNDEEMRSRLRRQFGQLGGVARMLDSLRGQKQIIFLSEGFDPRLVQGRQDLSATATQQQNDAVLSGEIWKVDSDDRYGSATSSSEINRMAEIFRRSDVTLHAIDIKGLRTDVDASEGVKKTSSEALHLITAPTGGTVFKNATALGENFRQLLAQQRTIYLLAFEARGEKPGKFHAIKVKVPKARGARVTHRSGYYESTAKSALEQTLTLADIMMTDADVRDVPLSVATLPLPARGGGGRIPVAVEIAGAALLQNVAGNSATATLFVYAFDERNQIRDFLQQRITLDLVKSGAAIRGGGMRYVGMLELPPGRYTIKTLARVEESGRVGFLRTTAEVPSVSGPVILPPVFISDRSGWVNVAEPGRGLVAAAMFTAAGKPFAPLAEPALKNAGSYRVALFVHDTPTENFEITPAVISADGSSRTASVSLVGRTPPDEHGAAKLLLDFKPADLAAGAYTLQLAVKPTGGERSLLRLPFRVE